MIEKCTKIKWSWDVFGWIYISMENLMCLLMHSHVMHTFRCDPHILINYFIPLVLVGSQSKGRKEKAMQHSNKWMMGRTLLGDRNPVSTQSQMVVDICNSLNLGHGGATFISIFALADHQTPQLLPLCNPPGLSKPADTHSNFSNSVNTPVFRFYLH